MSVDVETAKANQGVSLIFWLLVQAPADPFNGA